MCDFRSCLSSCWRSCQLLVSILGFLQPLKLVWVWLWSQFRILLVFLPKRFVTHHMMVVHQISQSLCLSGHLSHVWWLDHQSMLLLVCGVTLFANIELLYINLLWHCLKMTAMPPHLIGVEHLWVLEPFWIYFSQFAMNITVYLFWDTSFSGLFLFTT